MRYVLLSVLILSLCTAVFAAPRLVTGSEATAVATRLPDGTVHTLRLTVPVSYGGQSPEEAARAFVASEAKLLGWEDGEPELSLLVVQESLTGSHVRFTQTHESIPVWRGSLAVHLDKELAVTGAYTEVAAPTRLKRLKIEPRLTADKALARALAELTAHPEGKSADPQGHDLRSKQLEKWDGVVTLRRETESELVVYAPDVQTTPQLAWRVFVPASVPFGEWEILIEAADGGVLHREDLARFAVDGTGRAFLTNPCIALRRSDLTDGGDSDAAVPVGAYTDVTLFDLNDPIGGLYRVSGLYCTVAELDAPSVAPPTSATPDFSFTRSPDGFEAAQAYYHIDRTQRYFQSLGFDNVNNRSIQIDVHGVGGADNSYYTPSGKWIAYGDGGVDDAEDGDIVLHEYGHSVQDNQVPGWGSTFDGRGMGEGFGDYLAGTMHEEYGYEVMCIGMWDATSYAGGSPPCLRRIDSTGHYPEDSGESFGDFYAAGELWSASLWQCHEGIGRETFDTILLESHFSVAPAGSFHDAVMALFDADMALYGGANSPVICDVMVARGYIDRSECPVATPRAEYESHVIDDAAAPDGDNDGVAEPGEAVTLPVTLVNTGSETLTNVSATLTSDQPGFINIVTDLASYADMAITESSESDSPHYEILVDPATPCGTLVVFSLDITSTEWSGTDQFELEIGRIVTPPVTAAFTGPPIAIPDANPTGISSLLNVPDTGVISAVSCSVNIPHTYIGDLLVTLTSPGGTPVRLHSRTGGSTIDLVRTYPVPTLPDGPGTMDDFAGEDVTGDWTLAVSDNEGADTGTLSAWSLEIDTKAYRCDFGGGSGCATTSIVPVIRAAKVPASTAVALSWDAVSDPCHGAYHVYRSSVDGMHPTTAPGTWPSDPLFENVTAADLDGDDTNTEYRYEPSGSIEYFLVVDTGTDGGEGLCGHFGG